jgi:short-subunit dehydrogenase
MSGDIGERETGERIAAETLKAFKIDILVNNAGMRATCPVRSSIPMEA